VGALGVALIALPARDPTVSNESPPLSSHEMRRAAVASAGVLLVYALTLSAGLIPFAIATSAMIFAVGGLVATWATSHLRVLAEIALLTGFGTELVFSKIFSVVLP